MALTLSGIVNQHLRTKIAGGLAFGVEILAVAALAVICGRLIWLLLAPQSAVGELSFRATGPGVLAFQPQAIRVDTSILSRENAFGHTASELDLALDAPETKLNFRLVGIRSVTGEGLGSVTIVTPDGDQGRFVVGDEIIPGVKIEQILVDRVVIDHNGTRESLILGPGTGKFSVLSGEKTEPVAALQAGALAEEHRQHIRATVSRDFLGSISLITVGPEEGGPGYLISPQGDDTAFAEAGFQAGDVVTSINGTSISSVRLDEVYSEFQKEEQLTLEVRRGNSTLNFELAVS